MYDIDRIKKNIRKMQKMTPDQWDAVCKNCGLCCLNKVDVDGTSYYSRFACKHCDLKNKVCKNYQERLDYKHCLKLTLEDIINGEYMPDSCAYVEMIFGPSKYKPKVDWSEVKQSVDSLSKVKKGVFPESPLWAARYNFGDMIWPGYDKIKQELLEFIKTKGDHNG